VSKGSDIDIVAVESQMRSGLHVLAVAVVVLASAFLPPGSAAARSERVWHVEKNLSDKDGQRQRYCVCF
jgi:hypothetical protein